MVTGQFRPHSEVQVYHRVLYWDPFCFCFILMTSHQSLFHRLGYLLMIASYIAPSALVQTLRLCKGTGILWSDGVVHGTWSSIQKMSNYVHHQSQWEVTSYLSVQLMWSCIVQCSDSQVSWDHSGLSWSSHVHSIHSRANSTLGFLRRNLQCCPAKLEETAYIMLVRSTLQHPLEILIWPRSYSGDQRGLLKGITGQHPMCPRCCMILDGMTLKTAGGILRLA